MFCVKEQERLRLAFNLPALFHPSALRPFADKAAIYRLCSRPKRSLRDAESSCLASSRFPTSCAVTARVSARFRAPRPQSPELPVPREHSTKSGSSREIPRHPPKSRYSNVMCRRTLQVDAEDRWPAVRDTGLVVSRRGFPIVGDHAGGIGRPACDLTQELARYRTSRGNSASSNRRPVALATSRSPSCAR